MTYRIEYSPDAEQHLLELTARQRAIVLDGVERHLTQEPTAETRNRKPMRPNPVAPWEFRLGALRVYFYVQEEPEQVVFVGAIGIKERNQVRIAGKVVEL